MIVHVSLRELGRSVAHQHLYYAGPRMLKEFTSISVRKIIIHRNFSHEIYLTQKFPDVQYCEDKCVHQAPFGRMLALVTKILV